MRKQTNNTHKQDMHTTWCKDNPNMVFDVEIVADIITPKSESKDIWQDKMLDITLHKQRQKKEEYSYKHYSSSPISTRRLYLKKIPYSAFHSEEGIDNMSTKMK
jgi:hypothetical protein